MGHSHDVRGTLWVPHRQAPECFKVKLEGLLVFFGLAW
jgi:hypothetical protein